MNWLKMKLLDPTPFGTQILRSSHIMQYLLQIKCGIFTWKNPLPSCRDGCVWTELPFGGWPAMVVPVSILRIFDIED